MGSEKSPVGEKSRKRARRGVVWVGAALCAALLFWLLNVSRPGGRFEGCLSGCAAGVADGRATLRVVSLNMLHGRPDFAYLHERLELIAEEIRRLGADIVLLQEVPWTREVGNAAAYLAERTGMNYAYWRANGNRWAILFEEGEAILSRFPLEEVTSIELKPQAGFFEHRIALRATALTPIGDIDVNVTHLTNGAEEANRGQAVSLRQFVAESSRGLAIVAGDFNAREDSPQIGFLAEAWVDSYRAANPDDPGYTCCISDLNAPPAEALEKRIDYIFVAGGEGLDYTIREARLAFYRPAQRQEGWLWASDHVGLSVTVEWGP